MGPVSSRSLFFDVQVVNIPFLPMQISAIPLPGYVHIFQQYLQHTYMYIHTRCDAREALDLIHRRFTLSFSYIPMEFLKPKQSYNQTVSQTFG